MLSECDCDPPGLRGIGTKCSIEDGVKHCECPRGFKSQYGSCEDVNECLQFFLCPSTTNCVNVPGSYQCECKRGYELWREEDDPKVDGCKDIDECSLGGTCVSATTLCVNTPGSYDCVCREGYYATAAVQGDTYMPMYNACYGKGNFYISLELIEDFIYQKLHIRGPQPVMIYLEFRVHLVKSVNKKKCVCTYVRT
ncbi:UNVERIFIED_CONTAM: Fbln1 [Trichonephila clavipes]